MPDQTQTCSCGETNATILVPVIACLENVEGPQPLRTWESDWFQPTPGAAYSFTHGLNLESPWLCEPMIVGKVHTSQAGWLAGEYVFTHGSDFNGTTSYSEIGWLANVTATDCRVTFGNAAQFTCGQKGGGYAVLNKANVYCKMVLRY